MHAQTRLVFYTERKESVRRALDLPTSLAADVDIPRKTLCFDRPSDVILRSSDEEGFSAGNNEVSIKLELSIRSVACYGAGFIDHDLSISMNVQSAARMNNDLTSVEHQLSPFLNIEFTQRSDVNDRTGS